MKFYETDTEFIQIQDNTDVAEEATIHEIAVSTDWDVSYKVELPSLDLVLDSFGDSGFSWQFRIVFMGFSFKHRLFPKDNFEERLLEWLNYLKRGDHRIKILDFLQPMGKSEFNISEFKIRAEMYNSMLSGMRKTADRINFLEKNQIALKQENELMRSKIASIVEKINDLKGFV